jgi:FMN phosphatase YigB (HAD superfamily)
MVRACKPDRIIFEKALETAGAAPHEVIHIGDSITSDIEPAKRLGITPIYISRKEPVSIDGVRVIRSLDEL